MRRDWGKEKTVQARDSVPGIGAENPETNEPRIRAAIGPLALPADDEYQAVIARKNVKRYMPAQARSDEAIITVEQRDNMFTFHLKGNQSTGGKTIIKIPVMGIDLEKVYVSNRRAKHLRAVRRVSSRLRVKNVYPGSLAEKAGIRPQDVILGFNNMALKNIGRITRFLQVYKAGKKLELKHLCSFWDSPTERRRQSQRPKRAVPPL